MLFLVNLVQVLAAVALGTSFGVKADFTPFASFYELPDCDGAPDFTRPINGDTCFTLLNQRSFGIHSEIASTEQYCLLGYRTPELCGCPNEVKPFTLVSKCLVLDPSIQSYKFIEGVCPLVIC